MTQYGGFSLLAQGEHISLVEWIEGFLTDKQKSDLMESTAEADESDMASLKIQYYHHSCCTTYLLRMDQTLTTLIHIHVSYALHIRVSNVCAIVKFDK